MIGFNLTFFVQHLLGIGGMTRRVWTYPAVPHWAMMNMISSIGAFLLAGSTIFPVLELSLEPQVWSARRRQSVGGLDA